MASPQPTDAHLRIAHSILEQVMVSDFTKRQLSILLFILRLSWGCGKKEAIIPRQSDFEVVGVGSGHIKVELDWLIESRVIYRNGNLYSFNKDYDQWRVSRAKEYHQTRLTEMVKTNINHNYQNGKATSQNGNPASKEEVTETGRSKLPKGEDVDYHFGKNPTRNLASPKEKGGGEGRGTPLLKKDDINISKTLSNTNVKSDNKNRLAEAEAYATAPAISLDIFIKKFSYAFGREPDSRERAQLRDLGVEVGRAGGAVEQQVHDAFKEAAIHNKCSVSYVRAVLCDWLGVPR